MGEDYTILDLFNPDVSAEEKQAILERLKITSIVDFESALDSLLTYRLSSSIFSQLGSEFDAAYIDNQSEQSDNRVWDDTIPFHFPSTLIPELRNSFDAAFEETNPEINNHPDIADVAFKVHSDNADAARDFSHPPLYSETVQNAYLDDLLTHPLQPEINQKLRDAFNERVAANNGFFERLNSFANRNSRSMVLSLMAFAIIAVLVSLFYLFGGVKKEIIYSETNKKDGEINVAPDPKTNKDFSPSDYEPDTELFNADSSKILSPPPKTEVQKWLADELNNMRNQVENLVDASSEDTIQRFLGAHEIVQINQNDLRRLSPYATVPRGNIGNEEMRNRVRSKNLLRYIELRLVLLEKNYLEALAISDRLLRDANILLDREYMEKERKSNVKMLHSVARINFCVSIILEKNAGNLLLTAEDWKRKGIIDESDYLKMKRILSNILQLN